MACENEKFFGTLCNGEIEICSITTKTLEESLDILDGSFFINECVCIGSEINLLKNSQARKELRELCKIVANDGVSLMARHIASQKIIAVAFNKLQFVDDSSDECFFEEFKNKNCSSPSAISLMEYMITMDEQINIFDIYKIDCALEIMFLATLPECERKGVGRTLCKYSIDLARKLNQGIGVDDIDEKLRDKRPEAVCALFTSKFSQKIGQILGFKVLNSVPYTKYSFNGKTYAERIGPLHPYSEQVVMLL